MSVAEFVNNNSAVLVAVAFLGIMGMFAWDHRRSTRALLAMGAVTLVLAGGFWTSREGPSDVATIAEVDRIVGSGTPVVLEVYSDSCTICLISKRSVDGMEADLDGDAIVLRLNLGEEVGKETARRYGVGFTPTFVVFTADGREVHRESGFPDIDRLKSEVLSSA